MARKNLACRTCEFRLLVFRMGKLIPKRISPKPVALEAWLTARQYPTRWALSTPHIASSLVKILLGASWIDLRSGRQCSWCNLSNYTGDDSGILSNPSLCLRVEFIFYSSENQNHGVSPMTADARAVNPLSEEQNKNYQKAHQDSRRNNQHPSSVQIIFTGTMH